jgi:DNA-binding PadR family transcriptional regulator
MRTPRTELSLTEWVALALASEAPTHGWTIVRELRRDGPIGAVWSTSGPLVYRAISRLLDVGLLRSVGLAEGQGPNRVILEATPAGAEMVAEWLEQPVDHVREMRTAFLVKVLLLERRGGDRRLLVGRQRERLGPVAAALAERAAGAPDPDRPVAAWRAYNADAVMRFLDAIDPDRPDDPGSSPRGDPPGRAAAR